MKDLIILAVCILSFTGLSLSQINNKQQEPAVSVEPDALPLFMNYQGVLTDQHGAIVPDNDYILTFRIYDAPSGGSLLWEEMQVVQVSKGLFSVNLGKVNALNLPFDNPYYLAIRVALDPELEPRIELTASPFSFMTKGIADNIVTTSKIADGAVTQSKLSSGLSLPPGGTAGGDLSGIYPNPVVTKIQGRNISSSNPVSGQVLSWNGSQWIPANPTSSGMGGSGNLNYIPRFTASSTLGNSIMIDDNGKLAINRPTATYSIDVGTISMNDNFVRLNSGQRAGIFFSDATDYGGIFFDHTNNYMQFTTPGTSYGERMRLTNDGRFGIGTTTPNGILHAKSKTRYAGYFETDTLNHDASVIFAQYTGTGQFDATGVTAVAVPQYGSGKGGEFDGGYRGVSGYGSGGTYNATVFGVYGKANGTAGTRIGVFGTTDNSASAVNYGLYSSGNLGYTGSLIQVSDQNLKTNIADFSILNKVIQLQPRVFSYSSDPKYSHMNLPSGTHYGLIAQELENVFPEFIIDSVHPSNDESNKGEEIKYKGVVINELIPVLIQAIKEQQVRIDKLEKEIEDMKK